MKKYFITTLICLVLIANVAYGAIIRVPGDQPTIQAGIDVAEDGDTVLVADGTWTGPDNKNLDFGGKAITVTSENGAGNCIIDCEKRGRGFYFHNGEGEESIVRGFTITNGSVFGVGGGIGCSSSSPTITDCTISGNTTGDYGLGGGIYCDNSSPTITNCTITDNTAGDVGAGGGIYIDDHSSPTITNCTISSNIAGDWSGFGGGISCYDYSSPTITNCIISDNFSPAYAGIDCGRSDPTITNCTITRNWSIYGAAGIHCSDSSPIITNCIFWDDEYGEISLYGDSNPVVTYSDIQGGWPGEGNINANPLFVDPDNGDYHLQAGSPCIDAGTPEGAPPTDIDGNLRDEFPDMGVYEYEGVAPGSINGTVTDMAGNPIKWALVIAILGETREREFTDDEGYYKILALEPGTYWVLCLKKSYKLGIRKVEVVTGYETTVNFRLKPKPE